jgi:WD40 repeat protein
VPLDLPGSDALYAHQYDAVVAASGILVVVASNLRMRFLNVETGEYAGSVGFLNISGPVTSACLSPDGRYVIVVGQDGRAVVGSTRTGDGFGLIEMTDIGIISVQRKHGIGWTTEDQLVFIGDVEGDAKHIFGFDISSGESFVIAELDGPKDWWLTASGTMC